jgi:hypothetical protein
MIGSCQLHEAWMDHYLTQAASKAKPNGGIIKTGSDAGCRTVAVLSQGKEPGKSD